MVLGGFEALKVGISTKLAVVRDVVLGHMDFCTNNSLFVFITQIKNRWTENHIKRYYLYFALIDNKLWP